MNVEVKYELYKQPRSDYWHYRFSMGGKQIRKSTHTMKRSDAEAVARKAFLDLYEQTHNPYQLKPITLSDALDRMILSEGKSTNTQITYRRCRAKILGTATSKRAKGTYHLNGQTYLHHIRKQDLEKYEARRIAEGYSQSTITVEVGLILTANKKLRGDYLTNPHLVAKQPASPMRTRVMTKDEQAAVIVHLENNTASSFSKDALDLFIMLLETGARLKEVTDAKSGQFDLTPGAETFTVLRTKTKTNTFTSIPLSPRAVAVVEGRLDRPKPFHAPRAVEVLREAIHAVCNQDPDRERVVIHSIRHTRATRLLNAGDVPVHAIQELLGHSQLTMTRRYAKSDLSAYRDGLLKD